MAYSDKSAFTSFEKPRESNIYEIEYETVWWLYGLFNDHITSGRIIVIVSICGCVSVAIATDNHRLTRSTLEESKKILCTSLPPKNKINKHVALTISIYVFSSSAIRLCLFFFILPKRRSSLFIVRSALLFYT